MTETSVELLQTDITRLKVQCIVNAANESGLGCFTPNHPCIDNAIHRAAGPHLLEECKLLGGVPIGTAKITRAYRLPSTYIIHVTGPRKKTEEEEDHQMLYKAYLAVLEVARVNKIKELAFCCISTGMFGFDQERAADTAFRTVINWLRRERDHLQRVIFVTFTDRDTAIYDRLFTQGASVATAA